MFKLMKLELKKFRIRIRGVIIANLIILVSFVFITITSQNTTDIPFADYNSMFLSTASIVRVVFAIFAAVLISRLIIGEYKNKTINIMFMYPIKRKEIMLAKLFIVALFSFIAMILSNVFLDICLYTLNIFVGFIKEPFTANVLLNTLTNIVIYSVAFAFINLIPVYFGMRNKSTTTTMVSAIIIVSVLNSGSSNTTLSSYIIIPIIGAIIGTICSYLVIKDVEVIDVIN